MSEHSAEKDAPTEHEPIAVFTVDGMPFVKCSCRNDVNPQSAVWLNEHWVGDEASGIAALDACVTDQRAAADAQAPARARFTPVTSPSEKGQADA